MRRNYAAIGLGRIIRAVGFHHHENYGVDPFWPIKSVINNDCYGNKHENNGTVEIGINLSKSSAGVLCMVCVGVPTTDR